MSIYLRALCTLVMKIIQMSTSHLLCLWRRGTVSNYLAQLSVFMWWRKELAECFRTLLSLGTPKIENAGRFFWKSFATCRFANWHIYYIQQRCLTSFFERQNFKFWPLPAGQTNIKLLPSLRYLGITTWRWGNDNHVRITASLGLSKTRFAR